MVFAIINSTFNIKYNQIIFISTSNNPDESHRENLVLVAKGKMLQKNEPSTNGRS